MNYCEKIHYSIYKADQRPFTQMVEELFGQLAPSCGFVLRIVVFGSPEDNAQYSRELTILKEAVQCKFGADRQPILSYVAQPPLDCGLVMETHTYHADSHDTIAYRSLAGQPYILVENESGHFLYAGGWQHDLSADLYTQAGYVFGQMKALLEKEHFPIASIIRQWNYIERITAYHGPDQHYQMLNNARSEFYGLTEWSNGYPAATGIGTKAGGILIDFDAAVFKSDTCYATPIDNKLQVAAHAYSDSVLMEAGRHKTTPKFERAKSMTFGSNRLVYISGTAAIRGEESLQGVGVEKQLVITLENIAQLTGKTEKRLLRVYLKNPEDYGPVKNYLSEYEDNIQISYLSADVCRDELLIEIEGIAIE